MRDERAHLQLFDLIARDWLVPSPVQQITFNGDSSAVAFACADGSVQLAATADKASPTQRTRRAVDTGRLTISPREKPFLPLKPADFSTGRSSDVVPLGTSGFAFAKNTGRINSLSPGGIAAHIPAKAPKGITVLAASPDGKTVAYACGMQVLVSPAGEDAPRIILAASLVTALAFSPDGTTLAVGYSNGLCRWSMSAQHARPIETPLSGTPVGLIWHTDGKWLSAGMAVDGFCLIDTANNTATARRNFPSPVSSAVFNRTSGAVVAAGAYRVAAWYLETGGDVMTGKPGLVLINAVATSPNRNLVAVGYANGLLSLAEIGQPSEILLREDTGAAITAMAWSPNGSYLALAGSDGSAALVEFPNAMFKS